MKPLLFDPAAREELREAVSYYEEIREGLGADLQAEVEAVLAQIARLPRSGRPYGDRGVRRCNLARFPYAVYYLELDAQIWIAAVGHQRRQPGYWQGRTPPVNGSPQAE